MDIDPQALQQLLHVQAKKAKTVQVHRSHGIEIDLIRPGRQVILGLGKTVSLTDNNLTGFLELLKGMPNIPELIEPGPPQLRRPQHQHLDPGIPGGVRDHIKQILEQHLLPHRHLSQMIQYAGHRIHGGTALDNITSGSEYQGRPLGDVDLRPV